MTGRGEGGGGGLQNWRGWRQVKFCPYEEGMDGTFFSRAEGGGGGDKIGWGSFTKGA